jgi:hypothetical protein
MCRRSVLPSAASHCFMLNCAHAGFMRSSTQRCIALSHAGICTRRYHAQQHTKTDLSFCAMGSFIWVLTWFRIPATAEWHNRALVGAAVVRGLPVHRTYGLNAQEVPARRAALKVHSAASGINADAMAARPEAVDTAPRAARLCLAFPAHGSAAGTVQPQGDGQFCVLPKPAVRSATGISVPASGCRCQCAHPVQQTGAAEGPPARLLNVVLVSKCVQLAMFSLFFRVIPVM